MGDMTGQVVAITGANAGIGKETAVALAKMGATVVMTSRRRPRGRSLDRGAGAQWQPDVELVPLDLASFASIHGCAAELLDRYDRLDVFVANAGLVMSKRTETADGFETTFGVNHLGHFYLTQLLFDRLNTGDPTGWSWCRRWRTRWPRRGSTSTTCRPPPPLPVLRRVQPFEARQHLLHPRARPPVDRHRRHRNAAHPGYVASHFARDGDLYLEPLMKLGAKLFAISPEAGARTSVYLASSPDVEGVTGGYFAKSKPAKVSKAGQDDIAARRLWDASEALVPPPRPS